MRTNNNKRLAAFAAFVAAAVLSTSALGQDPRVLILDYGGLSGNFTSTGPTSGVYTAFATTDLDGDLATDDPSSGRAQRLVPPAGTARFDWGLPVLAPLGSSSLLVTLSLTNIDTFAQTADATGTITVVDFDGDVISGDVSGSWTRTSVDADFSGDVTSVDFDSTGGNGTFDGNLAGSFSMDFSDFFPVLGITTDFSGLPGGSFFDTDFEDLGAGVNSRLVPSPTAGLLGIIGLIGVAWARRRIG